MSNASEYPQPTLTKATVREEEIVLTLEDTLITKTDKKGFIEESNRNFLDISGYSLDEVIGQPHNLLRHPDMPKGIFSFMWKTIQSGKNFTGVVKNLAKDGSYYWVITDFDINKDDNGDVVGYIGYRRMVSDNMKAVIAPIYSVMFELEKTGGKEASLAFLNSLLDEVGLSYDDFISKAESGDVSISSLLEQITPPTSLQQLGAFVSLS